MGVYEPSGDQLVQQSRQAVSQTKMSQQYGPSQRAAAQAKNNNFSIPGGSSIPNPGASQSFAYSPGSIQAYGTNTTKAFGS